MKSIINILAILLLPFLTFAQNKVTRDYVEKYKGIAIREMKRTGIPASITLAQGILESASGESILAKNANNHFGIKCKTEWTGPKIYKDDDSKHECFRVYPNADSSFRDHSNFLKFRPYYAALFELDPVDDTAWAYGLKKAGYATERDYPQRLLKIIDDYELAQYNYPELVAEDSILALKAQQSISTAPAIKDAPVTNMHSANKLDIVKEIVKPRIVKDSIINNTIAQVSTPKINLKDTVFLKKETVVKDTTTEVIPTLKLHPSYPINQRFKINQTTAIWGVKGRSFLEIANTYNLALYKLYKFNELPESDLIENDQIIFLGEKRKESTNKIHIVKNEESLYEISQTEGIQLSILQSFNPKLNSNHLKDGTIVYLFNMVNNSIPSVTKDTLNVINTKQKPKSILSLPFLKNKNN
jgi:LysM repeat protein